MSSLQKQLAAIAATSTHELDLKAQKTAHGKSLLFEPQQASSQSFETIYQICAEGFEELCSLDTRFTVFAKSIFSPQSKSEDRLQMTQKDNENLNRLLEAFMGLVGSRLLLKPALKCVEWLVRRFKVHEQNTDYFILTFLPYHTTPIFATVLSILPKQLSPPFRFLHPYVSSLTSPPRTILVQNAVQQQSFMSALNQYMLKQAKSRHHYYALVSFWASIVVQAIDTKLQSSQSGRLNVQQQREDELLLQILPTLNEALNIAKTSELTIGCYMIIVVLAGKLDLEDKVIDALMIEICRNWTTDTIESGLGCIAALAERRSRTRLPGAVVKSAFRVDSIGSRLAQLSRQQPVDKLTMGLAASFVERYCADYTSNVEEFLVSVLGEPSFGHETREALRSAINGQSHLAELKLLTLAEDEAAQDVDLPTKDESADESDVDSTLGIDDADQDSLQKLESLLSEVPEKLPFESFLASPADANDAAYKQLQSALELVSGRSQLENTLMQIPTFHSSNDPQRVSLLSFLIRAGCTAASVSARISACQAICHALEGNDTQATDYQALIPYAIAILADKSSKVRKAGTRLAQALLKRNKGTDKGQNVIWASDSLYDKPQKAVLAPKTAQDALEKIMLPALEECVLDARQIGRALQDSLDDSNSHAASDAGSKSKRLKSAHRGEIFSFLCHHAHQTQVYYAKYRLVTMLNGIGKSGSQYRSKCLLPIADAWASLTSQDVRLTSSHGPSVEETDNAMAAVVYPSDQEALAWLLRIARGKTSPPREHLRRAALAHLRSIWTAIKPEKQKEMSEALLDGALQADELWRSLASETLATLQISPGVFVHLIQKILGSLDPREQSAAKRRKTDSGSDAYHTISDELRDGLTKLTIVLEQIESAKTGPSLDLFYTLFRTLQQLQALKAHQASDLSYARGLVLSSLSSLIVDIDKHIPKPQLDSSIARAELLVECIRDSPNAQARNSAMLLLASLARRIPQKVLHTVVPIFTLISSTAARQSDDYSIHVVNQTIREVVPLVAEALRNQNKDVVSATSEVLLSFAAAFDHIPTSRRLQLFALLVSSLGPEESMFAVLAALVDYSPHNQEVGQFSAQLLRQFSSAECLSTISKYLDLCLSLFKPNSPYLTLIKSDEPNAKSQLVSLLPGLIRDQNLQMRVKQDLAQDIKADELRRSFARSLELTIKLSQAATNDATTRSLCPRIFEALLKLVPFDEFLKAAQSLLDRVDTELCRSVLRAMEVQVKAEPQANRACRQAALDCTPRLIKILKSSEHAPLKHSAVACLNQICEKFGRVHLPTTFEAAEAVSSQQCIGGADTVLRILSLHCLATTIEVLGNEFIPLLTRSVDAAAQCLEDSITTSIPDLKSRVDLHNAAYALFISIIEVVPFMVSAKSLAVMMRLSQSSAQAKLDASAQANRSHFIQIAATKLDLGVVCEVAASTWTSAMEHGLEATKEHIDTFKQAIENHGKAEVSKKVRVCFEFMLGALDFRRLAKDALKETQVKSVEKMLMDAFLALIMKINDVVFRPLFIQLVEWSSGPSKADVTGQKARCTTLFNFLSSLSDSLKGLVTSHFAHAVERASEILQDPAKDGSSITLKSSVLRALTSSFTNDQDDFWQSPARYDMILPALMGQIEMQPVQLQRISDEVIPAIVELATAASSSDQLKMMNAALLKQFRSDNSQVRQAAVKCQMQLTERLGEDWLSLLPEMLPLISELQDDDDERVERETHKWVKSMEDLLGESLDSMLQ